MSRDRKNKKKALKKAYHKKSKNNFKKSSGGVSWTNIFIASFIIIVVIIALSIFSWVNMPDPYVNMTEKDVIHAEFDGNDISIKYSNTYFKLAPKVLSITPIVTDYFPSQYSPSFSHPSIDSFIGSDNIQFLSDQILRNSELTWDYDLNITDKNLDNWIKSSNFDINPNQIINNTETTIKISISFIAAQNLDRCVIRLGLKNDIVVGNDTAMLEPFSSGYNYFNSGFYYEQITSSLSNNQELELAFQINITLNSSNPLDILNLTSMNQYRFIQISLDNKLISDFFDSGFNDADITFSGFDDPPEVIKTNEFGINIEIANITISPL